MSPAREPLPAIRKRPELYTPMRSAPPFSRKFADRPMPAPAPTIIFPEDITSRRRARASSLFVGGAMLRTLWVWLAACTLFCAQQGVTSLRGACSSFHCPERVSLLRIVDSHTRDLPLWTVPFRHDVAKSGVWKLLNANGACPYRVRE